MGVYFDNHKLVIITGPKSIRFNSTNKVDNSLKHETNSIIRPNEFLVRQRI